MDDKVFTFNVEIYGDPESYRSYPIYDDREGLIGAFIVNKGQTVTCFVAAEKSPYALALSTKDKFYFTVVEDGFGAVEHAYVTEYKANETSILVDKAL